MHSEKATKFCKIFTLLLSNVVPGKSKVKISQNFVAFSEYMNFTYIPFICKLPCHQNHLCMWSSGSHLIGTMHLRTLRTYCKMNKTPWFEAKRTKLVYGKEWIKSSQIWEEWAWFSSFKILKGIDFLSFLFMKLFLDWFNLD